MPQSVDARVSFITLATADLDAARAFYVDGLGWEPTLDVPGEIIFFQVGHGVMLGLYDAGAFNTDIGRPPGDVPVSGIMLAHNVTNPRRVDEVVAQALQAGATVIKLPQNAAFGGYHGHFADPNGVIWEVAYNPGWAVSDDGTVRLDAG